MWQNLITKNDKPEEKCSYATLKKLYIERMRRRRRRKSFARINVYNENTQIIYDQICQRNEIILSSSGKVIRSCAYSYSAIFIQEQHNSEFDVTFRINAITQTLYNIITTKMCVFWMTVESASHPHHKNMSNVSVSIHRIFIGSLNIIFIHFTRKQPTPRIYIMEI